MEGGGGGGGGGGGERPQGKADATKRGTLGDGGLQVKGVATEKGH